MKIPFANMIAVGALGLVLGAGAATAEEKVPAFPGAEGFGRYVTGGRGGKVYHVTTLRDGGTGSLRWALEQAGPRTIVFDVSGTIHLNSELRMPANTTIAGQTAPGDGICIADYPVSIGSNTIIRYMRFRLGNKNVKQNGADGWDGLGATDNSDIIVDHCSVSWSIDECCSIFGNYNTTVQWSIVSHSLVNAGHSKGAHGYGGNWGGSGASFHHNLIAHHGSRTPRLGPRPGTQLDERMDMRNNVIYNFGGNGCYGGEAMTVNIVNNYYKPGPASPTDRKGRRIAGVGVRTESYVKTYPAFAPSLHIWGKYFVEGNYNSKYADVTRDNWNYGMYNQIDTSSSATDGTWNDQTKKDIKLDEPMPFVLVTTHSAEDAYERVLAYAGASLSRDSYDELIVSDTRNGAASFTGKGVSKGLINSQDDLKPSDAADGWSAWPTLNSTDTPADTDRDGIPDAWELANGLDPNDASDGNLLTDEGYTMLEVYLASLVEDITEAQNAGGRQLGDIVEYDPAEDSYEISNNTRQATGWNFGYGISISNSVGGGYTTSGEYIGMGRDQQHLITLPENVAITWMSVTGRGRYSTDAYADASLVELNGTDYPAGTYTLPKGADAEGSFEIVFPEGGIKRTMTMTWTGNNPYVKMILHTTEHSGIENVAVPASAADADEGWYTLQGVRLTAPAAPGIYIHKGRRTLVR